MPAKKSSSSSTTRTAAPSTPIRVGVGGWTFEPWRDNFYPKGLSHSKELAYASRQLTAIEVNGTYYSTFKPPTFEKWRNESPDGFVFSLKANRFATNRRVLAEAGESIRRFTESGITSLGDKLGPIVWQFAPTKQFDAEDFEAFLALLPKKVDSHALRHVLEVRHESFMVPAYIRLARKYGCASVFTDNAKFPSFADLTADFVYARLMMAEADKPTGYSAAELRKWTETAQAWAAGEAPAALHYVDADAAGGKKAAAAAATKPRDVFVFFINGAKERAPAGAQAMLKRLGFTPQALA